VFCVASAERNGAFPCSPGPKKKSYVPDTQVTPIPPEVPAAPGAVVLPAPFVVLTSKLVAVGATVRVPAPGPLQGAKSSWVENKIVGVARAEPARTANAAAAAAAAMVTAEAVPFPLRLAALLLSLMIRSSAKS
jgi:hypothetical protein